MKKAAQGVRLFILAALAAWVGSCAPAPMPFDEKVPAQVWTYIGAPPVIDGRSRFRAVFCELAGDRQVSLGLTTDCDTFLWRLTDEPKVTASPLHLPAHDLDLTILIVPGAFADCFGEIGEPYPEGVAQLKAMGYRIDSVPVSGLSSSSANAGRIAEAVADLELAPSQRLVLLGYSKGTTDILHFLATNPELALKVSAVLSVAGAVNGSPLADRYSAADYDEWLAGLIPGDCPPGDQGVFDSLSRTRQFPWLATHPLPDHVRYFSLATFTRYADVQQHLRPTYRLLAKIHPLNDGQLLFTDQVIPGSTLMGYVNSDHWTVAIPAEETYSTREPALKDRHRRLRSLLLEAMIRFVAEQLNTPR